MKLLIPTESIGLIRITNPEHLSPEPLKPEPLKPDNFRLQIQLKNGQPLFIDWNCVLYLEQDGFLRIEN